LDFGHCLNLMRLSFLTGNSVCIKVEQKNILYIMINII